MRATAARRLLILAFLALPTALTAAETPVDGIDSLVGQAQDAKKTRRDLVDLVGLAMGQGKDMNINPDVAQLLGLRRDLRTRLVHYSARVTPDHLERGLEVVYRDDRLGQPQPLGLLLDVTDVTLRDSMKYIRTCTLRLSLDGQLEGAAYEQGGFKTIERRALAADSARKLYQGELNFWQVESLGLEADR